MNKKEFQLFCKKAFEDRGFKKKKNMYYLSGQDLLCGIDLQKSNFGEVYYINYYYFLDLFENTVNYPTYYESDIQGRVMVLSKKQKVNGKQFMTAQIEYEEYSEEELSPYFTKEIEKKILPPIYQGKKYILENLGKSYSLTLNKEEVIAKLKS